MNRTLLSLLILLGGMVNAIAQQDFTFISDRKFFTPNSLIGYDFCPNYMEIPNQTEEELSPGEYSFGISKNNLYVDGGDLKGVYSVNNINPTEYGYKLVLMNARDPRIQGHLKVILNRKAQVEALVFKKSNKEPEIIFFQAQIPKGLQAREEEYFTDRFDIQLEEQDSIWGMEFHPFLRIHQDQGGIQERLQIADSTKISFVEKITVIEKKKKKKKRKKKDDSEELITEEEEGGEVSEETVITELAEEEVPQADPGAFPPVEESEDMESALEEDQKEKVKVKIIKEYFIVVRSILTFEDGTTEDRVEEVPIKQKFTLYQTESNGDPTIAPYEFEISPKKGKTPILMHLTKNKTVSSIEINGKRYMMRGH